MKGHRLGSYVPKILPCGKFVNRNGSKGECCRTVCPHKSNFEIEQCYKVYKEWLGERFNKRYIDD